MLCVNLMALRSKVGTFIDSHANVSEARVRGEIHLRFSDDETSQLLTH